jgi:hypothetical protein
MTDKSIQRVKEVTAAGSRRQISFTDITANYQCIGHQTEWSAHKKSNQSDIHPSVHKFNHHQPISVNINHHETFQNIHLLHCPPSYDRCHLLP